MYKIAKFFLILLMLGLYPGLKCGSLFASSLSLQDWNQEDSFPLQGPWDFYWQNLLKPAVNSTNTEQQLPSGEAWTGKITVNGEIADPRGFASYRLVLTGIPKSSEPYELYFPGAGTAMHARIYTLPELQLLGESKIGQVGKHKLTEIPSRKSGRLYFTVHESTDLMLLVHVSNFNRYYGGLWYTPKLRTMNQAKVEDSVLLAQNFLAMGVHFALGAYLFFIWWRDRRQYSALFLATGALSAIIRIFCNSVGLLDLLPTWTYGLTSRLEFASMVTGSLSYLAFFQQAFPSTWFKRELQIGFAIFGFGLLIVSAIASIYHLTKMLFLYQFFVLICVAGYSLILLSAFRQRVPSINISILGCLFIVVGVAFDLLVSNQYLHISLYLTPFMIALFKLLQAQVVAQRAAMAYRESKRLTKELREKERARTAFFHNTSHELRTPLNGIIGFLELIQKGSYGSISPETGFQLARIHRLAVSLKNQVNTILDLARASKGQFKLRCAPIDLNELLADIENLAQGLQLRHKKSHFELEINWNRNLPEQIFIHDRDQLISLLRNLIGNAFKFSRPQVDNRVSLSLSKQNGSLQVVVQDQGIGIREGDREAIFEEFKQVHDDARRGFEGTGLGLPMVKKIVELSGGTIEVKSTLNVGTCFIVTIPEQKAAFLREDDKEEFMADYPAPSDQQSIVPPSIMVEHGRQVESKNYRILVVDDIEMNCDLLRDILQEQGYSVDTSYGGSHCLEYLQTHRPDLILLDLMMPEVSGEDVLKQLKNSDAMRDIPIILVTARASEGDRVLGLQLGADDYLAKPIQLPELLARVRNLLVRVELDRMSERLEARQKLVFMSELLAKLATEMKNVNLTTVDRMNSNKSDFNLIWTSLALPKTADIDVLCQVQTHVNHQDRIKMLNFRSDNSQHGKSLRLTGSILANSGLENSQLLDIWQKTEQLDPLRLQLMSSLLSVYSSLLQVSHENYRLYELTMIILRFGDEVRPDEACSARELVDDVLKLIMYEAQESHVQITANVEADIRIKMAAIDLSQIILKLLHQAIHAYSETLMEGRSITLKIEKGADGLVHISCQDFRQSIPDSSRANGFEPERNTQNGSGLDIRSLQKMVLQAKGDMVLRPEPDTCFEIKLPGAA